MAYTVRNSSNVVVATVADNSIDTSTDITLIGKNYTGYGQKLNENLIVLLENFSKTSAPVKPIRGQIWFDSNTNDLKVYNGSAFVNAIKAASSLTVSSTLSVTGNANVGNLITSGNITAGYFIGDGSQITNISGVNSIINGNSNVRVIANSNVTVSVAGNANVITITGTGANISGTANVSGNANVGNLGTAGLITATGNVTGGNLVTGGVLSVTGNVTGGNLTTGGVLSVTGNANVGNLGTTTLISTTGNITTVNSGLIQNGNSNVAIAVDSNVTVSVTGTANVVNIQTANVTLKANLLPNANATFSLGSTSLRWANVWGVSSSALYADLAEKYWSDDIYDVGTVVKLGGTREITICNEDRSNEIFGCISQNPAYLMNDNNFENYQPVVLLGRSVIKIIGKVSKGDRLVSAGNGCARKATDEELSYQTELGRALSEKNYEEIALIEAFISTK
jgi:hypothetical protein